MIFGTIQTLKTDRCYLPAALLRGLDYLCNTDFTKVESGRHEIDGTAIFALVQEYQTLPREKKKPEAHRKYVDIQYVFQGTEIIGYGLESPMDQVAEDRLAEKDLLLYHTIQNEMDLIVTPGTYVVLFPQDIHRPGCCCGGEARVKKVVVKIRLDLL